MGDPTAHGGLVAAGEPTVLINGAPAARLGDAHVCPLTSGAAPHVGGPVAAGSTAVRINGHPAARTGDLCTCCGPPDVIAGGEPTVQIGDGGSGQTLIGGGGGRTRIGGRGTTCIGGGGTAGAGWASGRDPAGALAAKQAEAAAGLFDAGPCPAAAHAFAVRFVDAGKRPLASHIRTLRHGRNVEDRALPGNGGVHRSVDAPGEKADVRLRVLSRMRWSRSSVGQDEPVDVTARAAGFDDGTPARIVIRRLDASGHSPAVDELRAVVQGEEIVATWTGVERAVIEGVSDPPGDAERSQLPPAVFVAEATVDGAGRPARTGPLSITGDLSARVLDTERRPLPDLRYRLFLSGGEIREGRTDASGVIVHRDVPAGCHRLQLTSPPASRQQRPVPPSDSRPVRRATPGRTVGVSTGEETDVVISGPWIPVAVWMRGSESTGRFILHATGARSPNDAVYWQEMHAADGTREEGRLRLCFPAGEDTDIAAAPAFTLRRETADAVDVLFDGVPREALMVADSSQTPASQPV